MRILRAFLLGLVISTAVNAATPEQVHAWKLTFPRVGVDASFALRQIVSWYEGEVARINTTNLESTIRRLKQKAEADLSSIAQTLPRGEGPSAKEAREKQRWISNQLFPFLGKMG